MLDLILSIIILTATLAGIALFTWHRATRGEISYARIEKQGSSALLGKNTMNMGYWWVEPLGKFFQRHDITPNQISWTSLAFGLGAGIAVGAGHFGLAGLCLLLAGFMDMLDGMVARLQGSNDPAGIVLDSSLDRYVDFFFLAGLTIYYKDSTLLMLLPLLAILGSFMVSYSTAKAEAMHITPPRGAMKRSERMTYLIVATVFTPLSLQFLEHDWRYEPALALPLLFVVSLIAIMSNVSAVQRLRAIALEARRQANQG